MLSDSDLLKIYFSIKKHYSDRKYDLSKDKFVHIKFNPKMKELFFLRALFDKCGSKKEFVTYMVSNFAVGNTAFIYSINEESDTNYHNWLTYRNSYTYQISKENSFISKVLTKNDMKFDDLFVKNASSDLPPILALYLAGKISIQYICLLDNGKNFLTRWLQDNNMTLLFEKDILRILKTKFFLTTLEKQREVTVA